MSILAHQMQHFLRQGGVHNPKIIYSLGLLMTYKFRLKKTA